jgi:saccharopine dehydrogenase-like NADP-dependent oxidoreductase
LPLSVYIGSLELAGGKEQMRIAVLGAGLMGRAAVFDLAQTDSVKKVGVFDINGGLAREVANKYGYGKAEARALDAADETAVAAVLRDFDAAVSCVSYVFNLGLTKAAAAAGCHLVDLGGNNDVVRQQLASASSTRCGHSRYASAACRNRRDRRSTIRWCSPLKG